MGEFTVNGIVNGLLIRLLNILEILAHDQGELDLIAELDTLGADHRTLSLQKNGCGRLQEEEGLLGPGAVELGNMVPE